MKKKIATMLIMCCLISGMITDSVVYGADCGAVLNPFSGENLDEIIDELEELTYLTEDYNFEYRVFTNPATNQEEIEIVNYGSWQLGNLANLVIPSMIDGKSVSRLRFFAPNGYVKSIEISDGINQISGNTFAACWELAEINVNSNNEYYCSVDGILYDKLQLKLLAFPHNKKVTGALTIPSTVTSIEKNAFWYCKGVTDIEIPVGVTQIGEMAFCGSGLMDVEIPSNVVSIGSFAFASCDGLTKVTIPANVIQMGNAVFSGCKNLSGIEVSPGNTAYCSDQEMLYNRDKTELYVCPAAKAGTVELPFGVTQIRENAFLNCNKLTNITIPESVAQIGAGAFKGCGGLTEILIPKSVTRIEEETFEECSGLDSIVIPENVTYVDDAFYGCSALRNVTVLSDTTEFSYGAFDEDMQLTIHCKPGSKAEEYAKDKGISYDNNLNNGSDIGDAPSDKPDSDTEKPSDTPSNENISPDISVNEAVSISLNKLAIQFDAIGKSKTLTAVVTPDNQSVTWNSNAPEVATVRDGVVTATGNGTAVITATAGNQSASATVTVSQRTNKITLALNSQPVSGTLKARVKKSYSFKAKVEPSNADSKNKKVTWKSSNSKIAAIKNGKVTIKKAGAVTIIAKTADGKTAKVKLKCAKNPVKVSNIKIYGKKTMAAKSIQNMRLTITPATADNSKVTWSSSDKKIATVDKKGKVTAKKKGTVKITAKARDGSGKKGITKIKVK